MRWYVSDFNGVLADLRNKIGSTHLANPRDADVLVVWQDVLGSYGDLIKSMKYCGINKPVFTVQHGRAATSDYDKPNAYPLSADYFLCWGKSDFARMERLGFGERTQIVGCPLNTQIKPKVPHKEKVILFVPVNSGKEEAENIAVYYRLLEYKYAKASNKVSILKAENQLLTSQDAFQDFDVVAKLLPWHDQKLYHGKTLVGNQYDPNNNKINFELLRNVDLVVGLDEGCTEIFAMAHDVPVIVVDGFKYKQYKEDGKSYTTTGVYQTRGAIHCQLEGLQETIDFFLAHPESHRKERAETAEAEMGISLGNPTENIYKFVREKTKSLIS